MTPLLGSAVILVILGWFRTCLWAGMRHEPLVFRRPTTPTIAHDLSHGDILYRLSIIAPHIYKALEICAREQYKKRWPIKEDVERLLRQPD